MANAWRLRIHKKRHPTHQPIGQYGTADACGTCSGFTWHEIFVGAVSHYETRWWSVKVQRKY